MFLLAAAMPVIFLPFLAPEVGGSLAKLDSVMQQTGSFWAFAGALVAGAGIRTRAGMRSKGVHGSMYYLLSMPVSRLKLFASRVSLGYAQLAGVVVVACAANWMFLPTLRANVEVLELFRYGFVVLTCSTVFYFLAVLAASLIDDEMGKTWGSFIAGGVILWTARRAGLPPSFDPWTALMASSPLHSTIPWTAIGVSIALSALLILASARVVQVREYWA
jgi:hypothetical protein